MKPASWQLAATGLYPAILLPSPTFPIVLNLTGRPRVVGGGGAVGPGKADALLDAGAAVRLVLDFRLVTGLDSSAGLAFVKMRQPAARATAPPYRRNGSAEAMYFIESGQVTALLESEGQPSRRLRTLSHPAR
jgi:hypothetical protein